MSELKALSVKGNISVDKDGNLLMVRSQASGGTQLYRHRFSYSYMEDPSEERSEATGFFDVVSTRPTAYTTIEDLYSDIMNNPTGSYYCLNTKILALVGGDEWQSSEVRILYISDWDTEYAVEFTGYINDTLFEHYYLILDNGLNLTDTVTAL